MPDLDSVLSGEVILLSKSAPVAHIVLGAYIPNFIPVTLDVQFSALTAKIVLTFPLPFPASPLCTLSIALDPSADRGLRVTLEYMDEIGYMGGVSFLEGIKELSIGAEEYLRRGGGLSVVGWLWNRHKDLVSEVGN
jgi:hypothetical protein